MVVVQAFAPRQRTGFAESAWIKALVFWEDSCLKAREVWELTAFENWPEMEQKAF
jgi:hypothetical protein